VSEMAGTGGTASQRSPSKLAYRTPQWTAREKFGRSAPVAELEVADGAVADAGEQAAKTAATATAHATALTDVMSLLCRGTMPRRSIPTR